MKTIDKIREALPQNMELIDCRKKPLIGLLWGKRNTKAVWMIQTPRKKYWFRSIAAMRRWTDHQGITTYAQDAGQKPFLRNDDFLTHTRPKRLCFTETKSCFIGIVPARNTWSYRKKAQCDKCEAFFEREQIPYTFENGILKVKSKEAIVKFARENYWAALEVSHETLLDYQKNDFPK